MQTQQNYRQLTSEIPANVQLVAVSKTHPAEAVREIYDLGQRVFGENKVQELLEKYEILPKDIRWHLIGHLQSNKVKYIADFIDVIESVDSEKLLLEIDRQAEKHQRKIKILLQVKIAEEDTKFGLQADEARELFRKWSSGNFPNVEIIGLMGMASFTEDENKVRREFSALKNLYNEFSAQENLSTLSMGMSGDWKIAVDCGSNSVRIGSSIFGERIYKN